MLKQHVQIYQIKVTLDGIRPPVWRRFLVSGSTSLLKLHDILQILMGWDDYHLHAFTISGMEYGNPEDDEFGDRGTRDEARYRLSQVIHGEGQRFTYEYDFGDGWQHTLLVEKILPPTEGVRYPLCLKGLRACPPEDVGGIWGYANFLKAIADPHHEEHEQILTWIGGEFDPDAFDLEQVNADLLRMGRGQSTEDRNDWSVAVQEAETGLAASPWPQSLPDDQRAIAENLPLRRDVVALVTYLRDNKVTGTQSSGNLPLKAVYAICASFVDPPELDLPAGEQIFRTRSESEVEPLYFRHMLASVGGLVAGGMGRLWKLTPLGELFLASPAALQVWHLCATWWTRINWAIAFPYDFGNGYMPEGFTMLTLKHLLDLPVNDRVSFETLAGRLIKEGRLAWPTQDQDNARRFLRDLIERTVVKPQLDFGILQAGYVPKTVLGMKFHQLSTLEITPFGRGLLEAIKERMQ